MILGVSKVRQKGTTPLFSLGILSTNSPVDSAYFSLSLKILDGRAPHTHLHQEGGLILLKLKLNFNFFFLQAKPPCGNRFYPKHLCDIKVMVATGDDSRALETKAVLSWCLCSHVYIIQHRFLLSEVGVCTSLAGTPGCTPS